jgi:hypothetical protein
VKGKTSFAASVRRSWLEALSVPGLALMNNKDREAGKKTFGHYAFSDVNLKVNHHFDARSRASVNFYYGDDYFKIGESIFSEEGFYFVRENITTMKWGNMLISAEWLYEFNDKLTATVTPSFTRYASSLRKNVFDSANQKEDADYEERRSDRTTENGIYDLNGSVHFDYRPASHHHINFGANYVRHRFLPEWNTIRTTGINGILQSEMANNKTVIADEVAIYVEYDRRLSKIFRLNVGIRTGAFKVEKKAYLTWEPRVSARISLSDYMSFKSSYSRMNQFVQQISDSYISLPTDFWIPVYRQFRPLTSDQISAGFYCELPNGYSFSAEGYYKQMHNLLEYKDGYTFMPASADWNEKLTAGKGRAYGAEWIGRKETGKITGTIGYGLMWSDRLFTEINDGRRFPSKYDNRHKINVNADYKLNSSIEFSGSWIYVTGNRITLALDDYLDLPTNGFDPSLAPSNPFQDEWTERYESRNNVRLPASHRLDVGINIYRPRSNGRTGIWNISIWNIYNRINPIIIRKHTWYSDADNQIINPEFQTVGLFPIIPSVSYTYKF